MLKKSITKLAMAAVLIAMPATKSIAAETVLQAASCFPQGSFFSKRFEAFIDKVNADGAGIVSINYVGGAPAIGSPFTLVQKLSQGVFDLSSCTGAYYGNVVPEADAWKMLELTPTEIRANGGWDLISEIHRASNLLPLARSHYGIKFHLYLDAKSKIDKPDLSSLHLRVVPIYTNFFKALGATTQNSNMAQIFTLMENGTVNGYGWPVIGHQPGWADVTKYRVDPGFYDADIQIIANATAWDGLSADAQAVLSAAAAEIEAEAMAMDAKMAKGAGAKQLSTGFEQITFSAEDEVIWSNTARDAGWAGVIEVSPENGPKLRALFTNQ